MQTAIAAADPEALSAAVAREASGRLGRFVAGIRAYHAHPYRRAQADHPVLWREGATQVLDYGGDGRPVLFSPSLINRAYILDLRPGASLIEHLRAHGLRPLLVDWGDPADDERDFDLEAYITRRLAGALEAANTLAGGPVPLVGYCMGGLLALAAALLHPDRVAGLGLLATPWDFHAEQGGQGAFMAMGASAATAVRLGSPPVPVDLLQAMFATLQPSLVQAKFRRLAAMDPQAEATRDFVALEDWLNDGVALAAPTARDCFVGWYGDNLPGRGLWTIAGQVMRPQDLAVPAFVAVPTRDRIVPPASATALARALPAPTLLEPRAGHIGMVVGSRAREALWEPLTDWLAAV
ncbi:MAG: alpha/beta fold hydrolase [Proteobacteria bacterium]|nr:alpha/beta fold hydrolase [Pseudomonadota bacterium]